VEIVAKDLIRCNIVIKEFSHGTARHNKVLFRIPDCLVPPGKYSDDSFGRNDLDSARLTIHDVAWRFFDPTRQHLDEFEGTDAFIDGEREVIVYVMKDISERALEDLVNFLAEEYGSEAP
jgi:hypothetical protein